MYKSTYIIFGGLLGAGGGECKISFWRRARSGGHMIPTFFLCVNQARVSNKVGHTRFFRKEGA